jgi:hypothetical protein
VAVIEENWLADLSETLTDYASIDRFAMREVTPAPHAP